MKSDKWRRQEGHIKADEYAYYFNCRNCKEKIYVFIKKGTSIDDVATLVTCQNCGVYQK